MLKLLGEPETKSADSEVDSRLSIDLACAVVLGLGDRFRLCSDERALLDGVVDILEAAALLCPKRGAETLGAALASLRSIAIERGVDISDEADQPVVDQQMIEKFVHELVPGDMVDPESCPKLRSLPFCEDVYVRVRHIWLDDDGTVRIFYDSYGIVAYDKSTRVLVVKHNP